MAIRLLMPIMGLEHVKVVNLFSRGVFREITNIFVMESTNVKYTRIDEITANFAALKNVYLLVW